MSCETNPNKAARAAGKPGIPRLASRSAFYLGLAAGVVIGGLFLARRRVAGMVRRLFKSRFQAGQGAPVDPCSLPELPSRTVVKPVSPDRVAEDCAACGASPKSKPGLWYVVGGEAYCQDCAPQAAREADVDLAVPSPAPPPTPESIAPTPARTVIPISASLRYRSYDPLNPDGKVETRLERRQINVRTNRGWIPVRDGYAVWTHDGRETGLGITPMVVAGGDGHLRADRERGWTITHLESGMRIGGPFQDPLEAQGLASILAPFDWKRPAAAFSPEELSAINQAVRRYTAALADTRARRAAEGEGGGQGKMNRLPDDVDLYDAIVVDDAIGGGMVRVIADRGEHLRVMDSAGDVYDIPRWKAHRPDELDYRVASVAMPFDPAEQDETCEHCGRWTGDSTGTTWFKIFGEAFCGDCAPLAAREHDYVFPDDYVLPADEVPYEG
ncbi:MAG TPA: hypothetical protein EYP49_08155 [Anaerolineae bacterium]|nr:hypothetical protein [Anaerolineae bacterium]